MRRIAVVTSMSVAVVSLSAQAPVTSGKAVKVDVTPARADAEVGQTLKFAAAAFDADGKPLDAKPSTWFAAPFDSAAADESGSVTFYQPGEVRVGASLRGSAITPVSCPDERSKIDADWSRRFVATSLPSVVTARL